MIYSEFLKRFGAHLFPGTTFSAYDLRNGWAWWNAQSFRGEGYCRDKATGEFFRFTMAPEMRGRLQWAIYTVGPSLGVEDVPTT